MRSLLNTPIGNPSSRMTVAEFIGLLVLHAVGGFAAVAALASAGGW